MNLKIDKIFHIKEFFKKQLNRINKKKLHLFFSYLTIIGTGIVAYFISSDKFTFSCKCDKILYEFISVGLLSFFSIIPIYLEFDVRGKKAFRAYIPGGKAGGTSLFFITFFLYSSSLLYNFLKNHCILFWLKNNIYLLLINIIGIVIYLSTVYLLIGFLIKLVNRIFNKSKKTYIDTKDTTTDTTRRGI